MTGTEIRRFPLPDVGEGLVDATVVAWHVRPGETVAVDQVVVEVETAKAVVELPCPFAGTVHELLVPEGATVDVGTPLLAVAIPAPDAPRVTVPSGAATSRSPALGEPSPSAEPDQRPDLVGFGTTPVGPRGPSPAPGAPERSHPVSPRLRGPGTAVLAKPPVRRLAKELGVDLSGLTGSGPGGEITREDVRKALAPEQPAREERLPVTGVRARTAAAMVRSAFAAPHVTSWVQVDVTAGVDALARLRELPEFAEIRISPLPLVARALTVAVRRHPMINSSWREETQEILLKRYVNLGIAVAADRGLLVPNVKDADRLTLPELGRAIANLTAAARAGRLTPRDLTGGTITITNVGVFGVDGGTPILPPGESAILAVGQVRDLPWVHQGRIEIRKVVTLALSFDHRVLDGDLASAVLRDVGQMLTDPVRMLAWS